MNSFPIDLKLLAPSVSGISNSSDFWQLNSASMRGRTKINDFLFIRISINEWKIKIEESSLNVFQPTSQNFSHALLKKKKKIGREVSIPPNCSCQIIVL